MRIFFWIWIISTDLAICLRTFKQTIPITDEPALLLRRLKMNIKNRFIVLCVFVGICLRNIIKKCFMPSLVEIDPMVLEKVFKCLPCIFSDFAINRLALLLNKLDFPLPKGNLWLVWLKMAQRFWRARDYMYVHTDEPRTKGDQQGSGALDFGELKKRFDNCLIINQVQIYLSSVKDHVSCMVNCIEPLHLPAIKVCINVQNFYIKWNEKSCV